MWELIAFSGLNARKTEQGNKINSNNPAESLKPY